MNNTIVIQRVESAAIFIAATYVYFANGLNWILYLVLLFSFDIVMGGYAINNRIGAYAYNFAHNMAIPAILVIVYIIVPSPFLLGFTCLWFAHIGLDRALGYGLKFTSGFEHTHLGKIGKKR